MNQTYGKNSWRYDDNLFVKLHGTTEINGRIYSEYSGQIHIETGTVVADLSESYTELVIYAEEHIPVIYHGIRSTEKRMFEAAKFKFYADTYPYAAIWLNLTGTNEVKLFCVFISGSRNLVRVVKQPSVMYTGNNCTHTTYSKDT